MTSTEKRHKAAVPRWNLFAAKEGIATGDENFLSLVDEEGKPTKEGNQLMQRFAVCLNDMSDMTYNVWIVCFNWAQRKLKQQTAAHDLSDPKGHIRGLPKVQELNNKWFKSRNGATLVRKNEVACNNMHAQIEKNMTKSQIILAHETCLNDDARLKCRPINSVNLLLSFASTMAHCTRSESDRNEYLVCIF